MKLELAGLSPEIWPRFCMRLWVRQWPGLRSSPRFVHWLQWLCLGTWRSLVSIHMASPCSNLRVTVFLLWWPTGPQPVFHKKAADALGTWPWMSTAWLPPLSMHCGGGSQESQRQSREGPGLHLMWGAQRICGHVSTPAQPTRPVLLSFAFPQQFQAFFFSDFGSKSHHCSVHP